jgi:hypothetical protein
LRGGSSGPLAAGLLAGALVALVACSGGPHGGEAEAAGEGGPRRSPRPDLLESLRQDLAAERHPSDGGGRAWLEAEDGTPAAAVAGLPGRWTIVYEAGPLGIAEGGMIFLQVSPFWGWSTPQTQWPRSFGYTEVSTAAEGVELGAQTLGEQLLGIAVGGRALERGERVRIVYGAGEEGAVADRFAEHRSHFWIAVDGDGDGVRKILADSPAVDVAPGPPARLLLLLPSTARPGEAVRLTAAVVDALGNAGVDFAGRVRLAAGAGSAAVDHPSGLDFTAADRGRLTVEVTPREPGVVRLEGEGPWGLEAESNPVQVSLEGARILWGDLHNHSNYSDGSGQPEELFLYARDVAALDVVSVTDHDHWGMRFLDQRPDMWEEIKSLAERYDEPGRFVTLPGYEWTNWVHGHRHVLYFGDRAAAGELRLFSSLDPEYETPQQLWAALRGRPAITVAHHSAGGPVSTDWSIPPDPELEPVTEIVSVHGSSEALDSPSLIYSPVPGNFVRDALDRGYRLGFVGSSDSHDGHPGLAHLASPTSGLVAILAEEATREAVYEALRRRRVYATSGPRIVLRAVFGGHPMGSEIPVGGGDAGVAADPPAVPEIRGVPAGTLVVQAIAPGDLSHVDVIRSGAVVQGVDCAGERRCSFGLEVPDLEAGEYLYVRVVQRDGGAAWSSPFFFVDGGDGPG